MRSSRDYSELKNVWMGWFEGVGQQIKDDYENFVSLSNEAYQGDGKLAFGAKSQVILQYHCRLCNSLIMFCVELQAIRTPGSIGGLGTKPKILRRSWKSCGRRYDEC